MRHLALASQFVTLTLQVWIITLLVKKKLAKRFVWFLIFVAFATFEGILRWRVFAVQGNNHTYFVVYWSTEPFRALLTFCALGESFRQVLRPFTRLRWFRWIFSISIALSLFYWLWQSWAHPPADSNWLMALVLKLDLTAVYVPIAVPLLYFGLIELFGVTRHQRQSGIILGLLIIAVAEVVAVIPRAVFGIKAAAFVVWIPQIGYILAEIIWVLELTQPEPPPDPRLAKLTPKEVHEVLGHYLRTLKDLGKKDK